MDDLREITFNVPASAQAFMDISDFMDANKITEPLVKMLINFGLNWRKGAIRVKKSRVEYKRVEKRWKE